MKKILFIITLFLLNFSINAQVAIGKNNITNPSVSLEFGSTENRGLILPYVENKSGITENGTIIYDINDHKVKYLKDTNTWFDLSVDTTGTADIAIQTGQTESTASKTAIGTNGDTDNTDGILVLSDNDKAMILPKVANPHLNIYDPAPGMIVYDTVSRQLAVYNGSVWSFWKP